MSLIGLLIAVCVVCVVIWAVQRLTAAFAVQEPIRTVIIVVVTLVVLVWAISLLSGRRILF